MSAAQTTLSGGRTGDAAGVLLFFLALIAAAWPNAFLARSWERLSFVLQGCAFVAVGLLAAPHLLRAWKSGRETFTVGQPAFSSFLFLSGPVLIAVMILNLKRGPWLGVVAALTVLGWLISRRLLLVTLATAALAFVSLEPARNRMLAFMADFAIMGGRASMWALGFELVSRFPLGLGLDNASFMRQMDPSLPYLHRHMHNNLLNVTVESGFLGLAAYLWWIIAVIHTGLSFWKERRSDSPGRAAQIFLAAASCAVLGWQTAGLVEYNFGDGEVRLIAFFLMGAILALGRALVSEDS